MAAFTYTAKRSLIGGHNSGQGYSIDISLTQADRSRAVEKTVVRALGGATETLYTRADVTWSVATKPIKAANMAAIREFLDSTEGGETFSFDPYGTVAVPASPITVRRVDSGYTEARAVRVGSGGAADYFVVSFQLIQV